MYRILIADDEPLEREGMRWIISNMKMAGHNIEVIEAENGRDAFQKAIIYEPHIIFMDIRMPGMDGLQAIQQIQEQYTMTKFVMVSAYDDFSYAQKAIRLGVVDYLVKPAKRSDITLLIERLFTEIKQEQLELEMQVSQRQQLNELIPVVKAELAVRLIAEKIDESLLQATAELLQIKLNHICSIVVALPKLHAEQKAYEQLALDIEKQLASDHFTYLSSPLIHEHMVWFIVADQQSTNDDMSQQAHALSSLLADRYKAITKPQPVLIGIGGKHEGIKGARRSYYEAVFASTTASPEEPISHFQHMEINLNGSLLNAKAEQYVFVQQAMKLIKQEREQQTYSMMDAATHYIELNYQKELQLEEVADFVHLNPFYFSKVFKQQTGETFIDYVTRVRINHAKKLMSNKDISLKEICYLVGYNDPNYFSRVFKKVTGIKPSEYRTTSIND